MPDVIVMPPVTEQWSWKKLFSGFGDGKNTAKALVFGFHLTVIVIVVWSVSAFGLRIWRHFHPVKVNPTPICVGSNTGKIHSSTDTSKFGLINF